MSSSIVTSHVNLRTVCKKDFLQKRLIGFWSEIVLQKTIRIPLRWCDRSYSVWHNKQESSTLRKCQVPPQINEGPYLPTSVVVQLRNSTYRNERVQATAAGSTYANETTLNRDLSSVYENNANDIAMSTDKHIYEEIWNTRCHRGNES